MTESFRHCHTPSPKAETGGNSHLDDTLVWMRVKITDVIKLLALWRSKTYFSADKDLWHSAAVWDFILLFFGGGGCFHLLLQSSLVLHLSCQLWATESQGMKPRETSGEGVQIIIMCCLSLNLSPLCVHGQGLLIQVCASLSLSVSVCKPWWY